MSFDSIYNIAGSAMRAQTVRLDTVASNLANADSVAGSEAGAYHSIHPIFSTVYQDALSDSTDSVGVSVDVTGVMKDTGTQIEKEYDPNNPLADTNGYIYRSNVDNMQEMADMMSASRSFESAVQVLKRVDSMQDGLLNLGQSS